MEKINNHFDLLKAIISHYKLSSQDEFLKLSLLQEMKAVHYMQVNSIIENNLVLPYQNNDWLNHTHSEKDFYLNLDVPMQEQNYLYIRMIYVPEEYRKSKIATFVVQQIQQKVKSLKYDSIQLEATLDSVDFWIKLGFVMMDITKLRMIYHVTT